MPDQIARYGPSTTLPVIEVFEGVPYIFHEGRSWPAPEVRTYAGRPRSSRGDLIRAHDLVVVAGERLVIGGAR